MGWVPLATLADWSDVAGIAGAVLAVIGLGIVFVQLPAGAAAARAQATIQFQEAFRESREERMRLVQTFPVHESLLGALAPETEPADVRTWRVIRDLDEDDHRDARAVIGALNDVAQYVADGLSLRSALQQYHTWFVRAGWLLNPYVEAHNAPRIDAAGQAHPPARYGRRIPLLYNAGLTYHRRNPKHQGTELSLTRPSIKPGGGTARLLLVRIDGSGVGEYSGFGETASHLVRGPRSLASVIRHAQRRLRR